MFFRRAANNATEITNEINKNLESLASSENMTSRPSDSSKDESDNLRIAKMSFSQNQLLDQ